MRRPVTFALAFLCGAAIVSSAAHAQSLESGAEPRVPAQACCSTGGADDYSGGEHERTLPAVLRSPTHASAATGLELRWNRLYPEIYLDVAEPGPGDGRGAFADGGLRLDHGVRFQLNEALGARLRYRRGVVTLQGRVEW